MARVGSVVGSLFVLVALQVAAAAPAFAQNPPTIEPGVEPPPVTQQVAAPATAFDRPGVDLAARLGYAFPFGNTSGDSKLSDGVSGLIPLVLEAGYRFNANFTLGALFQYGFMQIKEGGPLDCSGFDCRGRVVRLGIEGIYHLDRDTPLMPWLGLATGYEWFSVTASQGGTSGTVGARGFEFVTFQMGADYQVTPQVAVGPFGSLSLAQYATGTIEGTGLPSTSMELSDKRMHEWLQLGVRGRIGL